MVEFIASYSSCRDILLRRLAEPAPGRIQLLTGPRQVGKTTLLLELARHFGDAAFYAAGDDPDSALPGFWERTWAAAEARSRRATAILLLDEVQQFSDWARQLKAYWDRTRRHHTPIHVVATGSSALRVASGSRESLAGRFERLVLSHWPASALVHSFQISTVDAAVHCARFGAYPGAVNLVGDLPRWRAYVRDAIIEPAIGRDLLALGAVRRPALLRQVFAVAAGSPAQIVSLQKLQGRLQDKGSLETVAHYLQLLQEAYLIAALPKFSTRVQRQRSSPPKLVALNNALLAVMEPNGPGELGPEPQRFGAWVENACLALAINQGQTVTYWREEPLEIDAVLEGSWGQWAVEVKTGHFTVQDLTALTEFCRRNPKFLPLLITAPGDEESARRHGMHAVNWHDFLNSGPPAA